MEEIGHFRKLDDRFEFQYPELGLTVRGAHAEWVLEAAAEILRETEKMRVESHIDELKTLAEFGEADEIEVDSAEFDANARFEIVPQCLVSMGAMDYHWTSPEGRKDGEPPFGAQLLKRMHDMSLTRSDSFLKNQEGVDTSGD